MNYQNQVHDATDGGYDDQHIPDHGDIQQGEDDVPQLDDDDLAAEVAPEQSPDVPPFPGGPLNLSLLSDYASHVALPMWYNKKLFLIVLNYCYFLGLNMIFVLVIWARFDFRPCKKKLFEKGPWPHIYDDMAWGLPRGMPCN